MNISYYILLTVLVILSACGINAYPSENVAASSTPAYVPHEIYPFNDGYGPPESHKTHLQPVYQPNEEDNNSDALSSLLSRAEAAIHVGNALRSLATVGGYLVSGVALLLFSGLFTIAVCSTTSLCTIKFTGVDQETAARYFSSSLTPEKLTRAAVLVEDAIGKYQHLQRSSKN